MKALHELLQQPFFSPLDRAFAAFVERRQEVDEPLLPIAAAWVSHQLARGHVCLDLSCPPRVEEEEEVHPWTEDWPSLKEWHSAFQKHPMVGGPGDFKPFLLEENRLYLQRYGRCEHSLVDELPVLLVEGNSENRNVHRLRPPAPTPQVSARITNDHFQ